jgi:inorganic pyrophosphatase
MVAGFIESGGLTAVLCCVCPALAWVFSYIYYKQTAQIVLDPKLRRSSPSSGLIQSGDSKEDAERAEHLWRIYKLIFDGAHSFLYAEYRYVAVFVVIFSIVIFVVLGATDGWMNALFTTIAFNVGCATSVLSGFVGMKIGVFANARTAVQAQQSLEQGFTTAFKAAIVMGFCLCAFGIFNLFVLIMIFKAVYYTDAFSKPGHTENLFEAIAGYGLGGSSIALFGRVGGGIYTKAADVGADLVGKVEAGIPEDDPRNPAVIADNVGDNVGDIAGMGADLFGSFAESSCAALVIASQTGEIHGRTSHIWKHWGYVSYPLIVSCIGIIVCFLTSFLATHLYPAQRTSQIEPTLKKQLLVSTVLMTLGLLASVYLFLPTSHNIFQASEGKGYENVANWHIFLCTSSGLWAGLAIGYITEYYTSNRFTPVQEVSNACETGAATNIIAGLALGYKSTIIPCIALALAAFMSHELAGFYGVAMAALGILSTLSIGLTIDAFGPISDNAGGIAEMCDLGDETRRRTDALDAAGNTTAAIGKGYAIGSAAFVSLALFSGYVTIVQNRDKKALAAVDVLQAFPFAGLLVGAMIPYWFSAMTMKSVGDAANEMVLEVRRQFATRPGIMAGTEEPDYDTCIRISTDASLKEMIPPGALVMLTPLIVGFLFGVQMLAGLLLGALVSGVQMAQSASNTGGAWDNAKKYIEQGNLPNGHGKGSDEHKAAVVGDTVGDPLKDTSGPSLNIVMKLMAIISLVFARAFPTNEGGLVGYAWNKIV